MFQSQSAYKTLRKNLVEDWGLYAVISLPAGVFNPYSGVKTSILLIDKTLAKERDSILFVKLNNDGFDLGAQRREIKGSEIPDVINIFKDYQNGVDVEGRENVVLASKTAIVEQDYILVGERYLKTNNTISEWQLERLGDVCTFERRVIEDSTLPYIGMEDVESESGRISQSVLDGTNTVGSGTAYYFDSDHILYGRLRPYLNKVAMPSFIGRCSTELIPIRVGRQVLKEYLAIVLRSDKSVSYAMSTYIGARMPRTDLNAFANLEIPVPPLSIQEKIIAEIESYQKIIDGARQVVENYKPTIKVDPTWETVPLGEICVTSSGGTPKSSNREYYENGTINWLKSGEVVNGYIYATEQKITEKALQESSAKMFPPETVVVAMYGATAGQVGILKIESSTNQAVCGILPNEMFEPDFLYLYMLSKHDYFVSQSTGGAQPNISQMLIRKTPVPIVAIEEQKRIAGEIRIEMSIVEQNKRLIEIFLQKIKDRIAEVWGE